MIDFIVIRNYERRIEDAKQMHFAFVRDEVARNIKEDVSMQTIRQIAQEFIRNEVRNEKEFEELCTKSRRNSHEKREGVCSPRLRQCNNGRVFKT